MAINSPLPRDVKGISLRRILTTADGEKSERNSFSGVGTCPHSEWSEVRFALALNSGG
jgi:hypothetical protein